MNTFHRFIVMLIGISLVVGPVVSWAAKGPCGLPDTLVETTGDFKCVNGHYGGTVTYHTYKHVCKNADENDCDSNKSQVEVAHTYVYSTKQSDIQKMSQKSEHDAIDNQQMVCIAAVGVAAGGAAWGFSWSGWGAIVIPAIVTVVGGVSCAKAHKRQMDAHEEKVSSCYFVSPDRGVPIVTNGPSCL